MHEKQWSHLCPPPRLPALAPASWKRVTRSRVRAGARGRARVPLVEAQLKAKTIYKIAHLSKTRTKDKDTIQQSIFFKRRLLFK